MMETKTSLKGVSYLKALIEKVWRKLSRKSNRNLKMPGYKRQCDCEM